SIETIELLGGTFMNGNLRVKIKSWLDALRLRTLPLALASISLGSFLAATEHAFQWRVALLCLTTAVLLQILSNLANDYGDTLHGADSQHRQGPKRATQTGRISKGAMQAAIVFFAALTLFVGYQLIKQESLFFYAAGLAAMLAALAYTVGPNPYGYKGMGDPFVFVFFGIVGVFGSYFLQTHHLNLQVLWPAVSCGLFCVAVLNINNIRDMHSDKMAGKNTIPVRLGATRARVYHWALMAGGFAAAVIYTLLNFNSPWQFLYLLVTPLLVLNGLAISAKTNPAHLDPYLRQMAVSTLFFSLTFGMGNLL
ncbi:MAG: 1,4-dihydroxy-2-naphthoate polyprenyltransferase, partial [bacterium]